jgi:hypothetical protein
MRTRLNDPMLPTDRPQAGHIDAGSCPVGQKLPSSFDRLGWPAR